MQIASNPTFEKIFGQEIGQFFGENKANICMYIQLLFVMSLIIKPRAL